MKRFVFLAALPLFAASAFAQSPDAMTPADEQICVFAKAAGTSIEAMVDVFREQSSRFPVAARDGLVGQITAQLRSYRFQDAAAYRVYELPDYTRIYAVPAATDSKMIFFVLTYERYGGEVVLTNFQYADKLENALKVTYVSDPLTVDCP